MKEVSLALDQLEIVRFHSSLHKFIDFDCGKNNLNAYATESLAKDVAKGALVAYVLVDKSIVIGFYTLASTSFDKKLLQNKPRKQAPQYRQIPAQLIGRFAVNKNVQGKGYGKALFINALKRIKEISSQTGIYAVTLVAGNEKAKNFYLKFGFKEFVGYDMHMYLPVKKLVDSFPEPLHRTNKRILR